MSKLESLAGTKPKNGKAKPKNGKAALSIIIALFYFPGVVSAMTARAVSGALVWAVSLGNLY